MEAKERHCLWRVQICGQPRRQACVPCCPRAGTRASSTAPSCTARTRCSPPPTRTPTPHTRYVRTRPSAIAPSRRPAPQHTGRCTRRTTAHARALTVVLWLGDEPLHDNARASGQRSITLCHPRSVQLHRLAAWRRSSPASSPSCVWLPARRGMRVRACAGAMQARPVASARPRQIGLCLRARLFANVSGLGCSASSMHFCKARRA